ncbi:hypothetical protein RhiirA5_407218 [Rhizophagus irregularis]|uniref:Uncharacterized protein n=1 Tax=Rhizophagus irregularis TaxID=588596 RepID=A0A2N0QB23_9GLOM|nr:hypothetical protein RhiirA5_432675 [Rhizophagus irregularis]PKC16270.1 hypothetical protein RhiirA5_407218 [Rhizophagus irregularis]
MSSPQEIFEGEAPEQHERNHNSSQTFPSFAMCCAGGKVSLPPLLEPPSYLLDLYTSSSFESSSFRKNIRAYIKF